MRGSDRLPSPIAANFSLMKKLLPILLLVLLLGAVVLWVLRPAGTANPTHALPAGTAFYAELTDLGRTLARWRQTPLAQLARDPAVAPFLQRPGQLLCQDGHFQTAASLLGELKLRQLFLALPEMPDLTSQSRPALLLGFRAEAGTAFQRELLNRLHAEIARAYPGADAVETTLDGITLRKQVLPDGELWTAVAGGWGLVSSDSQALRNFVVALRSPQAAGSLATAPDFVSARSRLGAEADFLLYVPMTPWLEALEKVGPSVGAQADPMQFAQLKSWRAFAFSSTFAGADSIERKLLLADNLPDVGTLQNEALKLAPANSLLFLASRLDTSALTPDFLQQTFGPSLAPVWGASPEVAWQDLPTCIGREGALFLWWPTTSLLPSVVVRLELADPGKAEQILSGMLSSLTGESVVRLEEGWRVHTLPNAGFGLLSPVLAFGGNEALLTLNAADLATLRTVIQSGENLASAPDFRSLTLPSDLQQLGFLDLPGLVRRAYLTVQPLLGFAAAMSPEVSRYVDLEKFPAVENITRYLRPVVATQQTIPGGLLTEVRGPVLLSHLLLGAAAGAYEGFEGLPGRPEKANP